MSDLDAFDTRFASIGLLQVAVFVLTAIAWLAWQYRVVQNIEPLGLGASPTTPWKAVLWWFVPFANLVMVYRIHRDTMVRYAAGHRVGTGLVLAWWLVYLLEGFITNVAERVWVRAEDFAALQTGLDIWIVADSLTVVSSGLAITLVRRIQGLEAVARQRPQPDTGTPGMSLPTEPPMIDAQTDDQPPLTPRLGDTAAS